MLAGISFATRDRRGAMKRNGKSLEASLLGKSICSYREKSS